MSIKIKYIPIGEGWKDRLLIAFSGTEIVGHCRLWDNFSRLTELYVVPSKRGGVVAEKLLIEGAAIAKAHGQKTLKGYCKKRLLPFYEKYGIKVIAEPDDKENGLYIMEYTIPDEGNNDENRSG